MNASSCLPPHTLPQHDHWQGKELAPPSVHMVIGVFITVVGVVAVVGNSLVVLTCIRFKDLRTRSNLLILNLAVGDLLMCTIDFPLLAVASFYNHWLFGKQACELYAFLTAVAGMVTINSLAAISADRYWAVVRRSNPRLQLPKCVTGFAIVSVWTYSIAWALCPFFGWGNYLLDGIQTTCTFDYLTRSWNNRSFVIAMSVCNFLLPFFIMIFSYTRIWVTIREVKAGLEKQNSLVSLGKCIFSFKKTRPPSIDDRFTKLNVKPEYNSGQSFEHRSEGGISNLFRDPLNNSSIKCLETKEKDSCPLVSVDQNKTDSRVYSNGSVVLDKPFHQQRIRSNFHQGSGRGHRSIPNHQPRKSVGSDEYKNVDFNPYGRFVANDDSSHYNNRLCKYSTYNQEGGETTNKSPSHHGNNNKYEKSNNELYQNCKYQTPASKYHVINDCQSRHNNSTKFSSTPSKSTNSTSIDRHNMILPESERRTSRTILDKVQTKYRKTFKKGLFLKQHRYRLHCEQKTMKIIMFLLLAFTVSWCPYMIISLIGLFGDASNITYFTSVLPSLLAKTSMVFNPILYSISHPKVRKRILAVFCGRLSSSRPAGASCRKHVIRSSFTLSNSKS